MASPSEKTEAAPVGVEPMSFLRPDPFGLVIFGATGDLTARKLIPALFDLAHTNHLPEKFYILGTARRDWSEEKFRDEMKTAVTEQGRFRPQDEDSWRRFAACLHYQSLDAGNSASYEQLRRRLEELDGKHGVPGNTLYYLAVDPHLYPEIVEQLGRAGLAAASVAGRGWRRIVIEKPFGHDLASARRLNTQVRGVFQEEQVYRIDHYLGKETVQNLMVFRFANGLFEPIWNRRYVDHVQLTVAEELGVVDRAGFYDQAGAVRDMIQNHLLQVLCLVAMEPPSSVEARPVQQEKLKVLQALRPPDRRCLGECAVRGQYGPGAIGGKSVAGYREEKGVRPDSPTETFAALRLEIDNWRWAGVPFYLRTGKCLHRKGSQITIQFREAPLQLFACTLMEPCEPNRLTIRLQPDEGIDLRFIAKQPGLEVIGHTVEMDFSYGAELKARTPEAYETLLLDVLQGDSLLFAEGDWIESAWERLLPLLEAWAAEPPADFPNYAAGTWGPKQADALMTRDGRRWHLT